jgi:hypothetical protein
MADTQAITIPIDLARGEAWAFAQLLKRTSYESHAHLCFTQPGSLSTDPAAFARRIMSASPPKRPNCCAAAASRSGHKTVLMHCSQTASYSITSSAIVSNSGEISRPSAFAVLTLMTSSNLVGCKTGNSAGFVPLRTLPV